MRWTGRQNWKAAYFSRFGYSVIDDSRSMILTEDGWVEARKGEGDDFYFFGYGHDYLDCLKDFYYLTGRTPMLPRFALGNWWSRYYKYTEESYLALMDRFEQEAIPFTVAVIDMDWHLVDVDPKYRQVNGPVIHGTGNSSPIRRHFLQTLPQAWHEDDVKCLPGGWGFRLMKRCMRIWLKMSGVDLGA